MLSFPDWFTSVDSLNFMRSDCLRWGERKDMLIQELTAYDGDIICLQVSSVHSQSA